MECLETAFVTSRVWQTRVSRWSVWQMTFVTSSVAGVFPQRLVTFRSYSPSKAVGCVDTRLSHSYSAARQVPQTLWNLRVFAATRGTFGNGYRVAVDACKDFCLHFLDGEQSAICLDFSRHCVVKPGSGSRWSLWLRGFVRGVFIVLKTLHHTSFTTVCQTCAR